MLVLIAVLAVITIGIVNVIGARQIFDATISSQVSSLAEDRVHALKSQLGNVRAQVSVLAGDAEVASAMVDLGDAFAELDGSSGGLSADQVQQLSDFYGSGDATSSGEGATALMPATDAGRYVQYYYIVENPNPPSDRAKLDDAGDGSTYSEAHARYHPTMRAFLDISDNPDLLLIDIGNDSTVVYSTSKRIDLGTSLESGPYSDSKLGTTLASRLDSVPTGDAILVDFDDYLPAGDAPSMFAVAAIRQGSEVVGAVAVAMADGFLDSIMTFDGQWTSASLGDSGEVYAVGGDMLMRTVSRSWVENPDAYLQELDAAGFPADVGDAIVRQGTTVLAQPVDTDAVTAARAGTDFVGNDTNYLGQQSFTFATPLGLPEIDWVVVAAFKTSEASGPLWGYALSLGLLALVIIPIVIVIAMFLARRLTRPVRPLAEAAEVISAGDIDATVPRFGRNEYGDLANRINTLTTELCSRDALRAAREKELLMVLDAALPQRLVDGVRKAMRDGTIADETEASALTDTCTVIAVSVRGYFDLDESDMEAILEGSTEFARAAENLAKEFGIERVRSTPDDYVFTAGLGTDGYETEQAASFVHGLLTLLEGLQEETARTGEFRIGMSAGEVATGLLHGDEVSFGTWGPPARIAMMLTQVAEPYKVIVDDTVANTLGDTWELEEVQLVDLQGNPLSVYLLRDRVDETS
jgi:HAMP domain-containing protein